MSHQQIGRGQDAGLRGGGQGGHRYERCTVLDDNLGGGAGGSAGTIRVGSVNPFSTSSEAGRGGNGGYDHTGRGSRGGDSEVRIVITYTEKL